MSTKDVQRDLHHGMQRPAGVLSKPKGGMENSEKNLGVSMGKSICQFEMFHCQIGMVITWLLPFLGTLHDMN
jgi:hypothetical protein